MLKVEEDTSKRTQLIIGLTLGMTGLVILVLGLIAFAFAFIFYKRYKKQRSQELELRNLLSEKLESDMEHSVNEEWIISRDDITFEERISEGAFGVVFKGKYKNKMPVAIKKLKLDDSMIEFESEVRILKSLRHPVRFVSRKSNIFRILFCLWVFVYKKITSIL